MIESILPSVLLGALLDCLVGDPHHFPHPVRLIGSGIARGERLCRRVFPQTPAGERAGGAALAAGICILCYGIPALLLSLVFRIHFWLGVLVQGLICFQILAARSLYDESMLVYRALKRGDLPGARHAVSRIVGRDTERLDEEGVIRAAVETVAENASDGVIAPLCFLMLGGAPLGMLYKGINTMDSMLGYRNERYLNFGRFAAKLDDAANFIPARLSGILMVLGAFLTGLDGKGAWRILRRDRRKHASPNSAHTEAACAGALGIRLAGDAWYFGKRHHKETLGEALRPPETEDIRRANRLMWMSALLGLLLLGGLRWGILYLVG